MLKIHDHHFIVVVHIILILFTLGSRSQIPLVCVSHSKGARSTIGNIIVLYILIRNYQKEIKWTKVFDLSNNMDLLLQACI